MALQSTSKSLHLGLQQLSLIGHNVSINNHAFELLKSLIVNILVPGTRSLVKCPAMWKDLSSNVPTPGTTVEKNPFCSHFLLI